MIILDLNLELIFSHMIRHPQKRVQKAALSAISGLCAHGELLIIWFHFICLYEFEFRNKLYGTY